MKTFKEFLAEAATAKVKIEYDVAAGDRQVVGRRWSRDLAQFDKQELTMMQTFFNNWKKTKGETPIFEAKHTTTKLQNANNTYGVPYRQDWNVRIPYKTLLYGVQISHRKPSLHVAAIKETFKNKRGRVCNLIIFVRAFNDYEEYYDWLSSMRSN